LHPSAAQVRRWRPATLAVCCVGMLALSLSTTGPAVCLTSVAADLGMSSDAQQGLFLGAVFFGFTVALLVSGPLADRRGIRPPLAFSAACQLVGYVLISQATRPWQAVAGAFTVGAGAGVTDALLTPLVCALFPSQRARMSNLLHAFYPIGLVLGSGLLLVLMRLHWSWRPMFLLLALLACPYGVAALFLPLPAQSHQGSDRLHTRRIVFSGPFVMLFLVMFLSGATELGPSAWLPAFIEKAIQGSRTQGGLGLMFFGATMAVGRLGASALVHRLGVKRLFAAEGILCSASLLLAAMPVGAWFSLCWLTVLGFCVACFWPTALAWAGDQFPRAGASMFSLLSAAGAFGGVAAPVAIGVIADRLSLNVAIALLAAAPLLALALVSRLPTGDAASPRRT